MCVHRTVHNCCTQYCTEQTWQFSLLPSRQSPHLRWCLFEGRDKELTPLSVIPRDIVFVMPALQAVYQATVMAKVLYAATAWWGFASASDRQRIDTFVSYTKRHSLCYADQSPVSLLVEEADDKLFESMLNNPEHVPYKLLPDCRHELT